MVLDGSGRFWKVLKASEGSRELARKLRNVGNRVVSDGGNPILLNQCYASPKRVCCQASQKDTDVITSVHEAKSQ